MNRAWILAAALVLSIPDARADVECPSNYADGNLHEEPLPAKWQGRMVCYTLAKHPAWVTPYDPVAAGGANPVWPDMNYWVYKPASAGSRPPLVVYLHGSTQTAIGAAKGVRWNELADRKGAIIVYPHQKADTWDWGQATGYGPYGRGVGDLEAVARITRQVQRDYGTDPARTYVAGASSGAITATMLGAMYSELYTAVGSYIGCSYNCADPTGIEAYLAMNPFGIVPNDPGPHVKVVPAFLVHGTLDHIFAPPLALQADTQWVGTNDWADNGVADGSVSPVPVIDASHRTTDVDPDVTAQRCASTNWCPGAYLGYTTYPYEIHRYLSSPDAVLGAGCNIVESWIIHGLSHNYPGGDPEGTYVDPIGPNVTDPAFEFFQHANCRNVGPDAVDDVVTTSRNTAATIRVLDNDSDADADPVAIAGVTQAANGTVTRDGAILTYTPRLGFKGRDAFAYTIGDAHGGTDTATVTVCVMHGASRRDC